MTRRDDDRPTREPVDLAGDLVTETVTGFSERLIIYRTTDRSTPCWSIRGSSVDHPCGGSAVEKENGRKRERKKQSAVVGESIDGRRHYGIGIGVLVPVARV